METSIWSFIAHAGIVVKLVLSLLVIASIMSWAIILQRLLLIRKTKRLIGKFRQFFNSGMSLAALKQKIPQNQSDMAAIMNAGCAEYLRLTQQMNLGSALILENCQRAMRVAASQCMQRLEDHVPTLATIGSTAPYVGLFGTVWGIMSSFQALGGMQQATIAMVAPGISEALIATAVGLFAAIPAVIAYNKFSSALDQIANHYDLLQDELIGIFQQHLG